ncbi:sulfurtransferase [Pseudonocardia endophytica]|uniref:Sulfurtransferase n=1 Tax=Pseudonocardia endophytica TaxID=401976 RepID=A0A4R1HPJ4_PSEEN|nr:sulfurtransferase [Pseudonocardia endophytica]TCK21669.1 thiosulfate/3-mercaptopyruvate sulfurtransferase [Pseudonocardia endophytica]
MADLITPRALADSLAGHPPPVVLDVRWRLGGPSARADHAARRVPGAAFVDLDTELAAPAGPGAPRGRHPLPEPERLQEALRRVGVHDSSTVVVYDDADGSVAARAWWLLRWAGFAADRVAILDGGFAAWLAEGCSAAGDDVPAGEAAPEPAREQGTVVVRPGGMPVLDADAAAGLARTGVLLDARAAARYRGETEPVDPRAGHIPGARNAPSAGNAGQDGRWLPPDELAARFRAAGADGAGPVGAYCGSGVTASSLVFALERAGLTPVDAPAALYPGSWSEWSADPDRPAATGESP